MFHFNYGHASFVKGLHGTILLNNMLKFPAVACFYMQKFLLFDRLQKKTKGGRKP